MKSTSVSGFTLAELLVSVAIFTVITTVSVFNYSSFNSSVALTNLAYEIALSVRQAQFYGITVKQSVSTGNFDSGYGVHFDANTTTYTLFEDRNKNHLYESANESLETYAIRRGNRIGKLCAGGTTLDCTLTSLDLSFLRPNPDTFIARNGSAATLGTSEKAFVCLVSPKGVYRKVIIEATGQISVSTDQTNCT